jgi:hypothetical protein
LTQHVHQAGVVVGGRSLLADRRAYERQIERLHQRSLMSSRLYELRQDDVPLASIVMNRGKVARLLAREVARGRYALEPGELRTIRLRNKSREVFACRLTDLIVHGVVASLVQESVEPMVSSRVFSYRKSVSAQTPVSELAAYLRKELRRHREPWERGVYVLRRDVDSYTDAIPVGQASPLWTMLEEAVGRPVPPLVAQVIRAELRLPDGAVACRLRGLPMGQPITPVIANLYLRDVDRALERIAGGFYARYGDDFLFAHPDPAVVRAADAKVDVALQRLSLTVNETKRRTIFLTPAGRASAQWPEAQGAPYVPFLGARVAAEGTVGLDPDKVRVLLREIDRRAKATVRTLRAAPREEVGHAVCSVVNAALDPRSAVTQQRSAILLRRVVTDRKQLEQIDYWIARIVVGAVTGRRNVRAFRDLPYRRLRAEWGLTSLVAARNRVRSRP